MTWSILSKFFNEHQISTLQNHLVDHGVTVETILDALEKFGYVSQANSEDALTFVRSHMLRLPYAG